MITVSQLFLVFKFKNKKYEICVFSKSYKKKQRVWTSSLRDYGHVAKQFIQLKNRLIHPKLSKLLKIMKSKVQKRG